MQHTIILQDIFSHHYRLHTPNDEPVRLAIEPKDFRDPVNTAQFVRHLRVPVDFWSSLLARFNPGALSGYARPTSMEAQVSRLLIQGVFKFYPVKHLDKRPGMSSSKPSFPSIPAEKGQHYQLVPASVLLVKPTANIKTFSSINQAKSLLTGLNMVDVQPNTLVQAMDTGNINGSQNEDKQIAALAQDLLDKKLVMLVHQHGVTPRQKESTEDMPAQGAGNKPTSLGPHEEGGSSQKSRKSTSTTYKEQDTAAKAALDKANPQSIKDNLEYGGIIYRIKETEEYGYTGPIKGTDQGVNPFSEPVPEGAELVGDYYTHADYSVVDRNTGAAIRTSDPLKDNFNSDNFSPEDIRGIKADSKGTAGYKGYLGTPSGQFKVYDPVTGMKSLL